MGFRSGMSRSSSSRVGPLEISLDIHLAEDLSKEGFSDLVVELFRFLLQQRQQIPMPYSNLLKDISSFKEEEEKMETSEGLSSRERRERLRIRKKKARFLKKAAKFSDTLEKMSKDLREEILEKDLLTATLFFGATPVTPKEVYHVHCPPLSSHSGSSVTPKIKRQIFRSLVTHEELFSLLGKSLPPSNIYTALKYKYLQFPANVSAFRPKSQFLRPGSASRGTVVHLNFILPHTLSTPGTNMKRKRVYYTPVPMDFCTPFTITKSSRRQRNNILCGSALKRLQAGFKTSSISLLEEEDETVAEKEDEEDILEGLAPLQGGGPILEEILQEEDRPHMTPSAVNSLIDSHQEKWFVSAVHLRGIK